MSPTFITNIRQEVRAVPFNPRPAAEHGHAGVLHIVLVRIGNIWHRRRRLLAGRCHWQRGRGAHRGAHRGEAEPRRGQRGPGGPRRVRRADVGEVARVLVCVAEAGNIWGRVSGEAAGCRGQGWARRLRAGAGAAAAVDFRHRGLKHGPAGVPVLEGERVPVGPAGPRHARVAGVVVTLGVGPAEADPVVGGEVLGDDVGVVGVHSHQVLEAALAGCERLQSTELNSKDPMKAMSGGFRLLAFLYVFNN